MRTNTKHPEETQPTTPAGQFVARRYRVDAAIADLIAHLAGLGNEVCWLDPKGELLR